MRSIQSRGSRAAWRAVGKGLALVAAVVAAGFTCPGAQAGGVLVSDGTSILRYNVLTGAFVNALPSPVGGMKSPQDLMLQPDGTLYYSAAGDNSIQQYNLKTGASLGAFVAPGAGGLQAPHGIAVGADGNLYVASSSTNQVLRYNGQTGAFMNAFVTAGSGGLSTPQALTFGPDGNLYVASSGNGRVLRYNGQTGAFMNIFIAAGSGGLSDPQGLTFGWDLGLYVASAGTNQVLRYDGMTGAFIDIFVAAGSGGLQHPTGLSFALDGNLYVCSAGTGTVLRYNGATGAFINTFVTAGSGGLGQPQTLVFSAPDPPSSVAAVAVSTTQVSLNWTNVSDEVSTLSIWRKSGAGDYGWIATLSPNTTAFSDAGLTPNTNYSYAVRTFGPGGISFSPEAHVTTSVAPAAPSGLTAGAIAATQIKLTWADNSNNETAFAIWRKSGAGDWSRVGVVVPNSLSFTDTGLTPNTAYTYRVRATNNTGASAWTNEVTATTLIAPPAAPSALSSSVLSTTQIKLTWADNSDNETAFAIWRKNGAADWSRVGVTVPNATTFTDTGLTPGTAYTYRVRATNNTGASAWTSEVGGTTLATEPVVVTIPAPAAPTGLAAVATGPTQIKVTWADNSNNETAFAIWRKSGAGDWSRVGVVVPNSLSFTDTGLTHGTAYTYRVRATNNTGASAWTNEVTITP